MDFQAMEEDTGEDEEQVDENMTRDMMEVEAERVSAMSKPGASLSSYKASSSSTSTTTKAEEMSGAPINADLLNEFCKKASRSFFTEFGLISHQINSYNDFIDNGIQKLFDSIEEIHVKPDLSLEGELQGAIIKFGKVKLEKPMFISGEKSLKLLPRHARLQHMTYASPIKVETEYQIYALEKVKNGKAKVGEEPYTVKKVLSEGKKELVFGRLPVMVNSKLCWMNGREKMDCEFDHGGYFLINGTEKIFVAQEQICLKKLWVSNHPNWNISYRADGKRMKVNIDESSPKREEILTVYFMNCSFPLWIFLYALGMPTDKQIVELVDINMRKGNSVNVLINTICYADDHFEGFRREGYSLKKIDELFKKSKFPPKESAKDCLEKHLFPYLSSFRQKAFFLIYMVKCLLQAYSGQRMCENKNDFRNKRLDLASELLERELQTHIKHAERLMVKAMQRDTHGITGLRPIENYLDASIVTNGINRAFSCGRWSHHFNRSEKVAGVVATLRRTNPLQITSDMRKTRLQYARKSGGDARFPHPSHIGRLCFLSTPDGENCGLVKNIAATGLVSTNLMEPLLDKLLECGLEKLVEYPTAAQMKGKDKVFLNGEWIGVCANPLSFVLALRKKRRSKEVPLQVEVKRDQQQREVRVYTDSGRVLRPLLVVENMKKIELCKGDYNIHSLLNEGIIELVGVEEEEDCHTACGVKILLSENKGYTHCELDASFVLGLSCGIIPFTNHDAAKRILYQSEKHSQQAIGFSTTNPNIRIDTLSHHLHYPQRPLFHTMLSDCLGKSEYHLGPNAHPKPEIYNGQNAIVAVNVHHGYNQEDSIVMNRASVERGMFRTEHIRNYKAEIDNNDTKRVKIKGRMYFGKMQSMHGNVNKLDDDGFPYIGAHLKSGDIAIGMYTDSAADPSTKLKHSEWGKVQKVVLSANVEGKNFASVSLRQVRQPIVGDKFSSMHGQKGVIGLLESQENFPFTCQGIVPDIVINPHAFPTRQTTGQLLEAALGKGIASAGWARHATPFTTPSIDVINQQLQRAGFQRWGDEKVCSGLRGHLMQKMIFVGPNFYQRLTIMSEDQVKTRSDGPVNPYTHQPVADRKRFGGLKLGEMERDCFLGHGAAYFLHERLLTLSDLTQMPICSRCSNMTAMNKLQLPDRGIDRAPYCRFCESAEYVVKVNMPYGAKLLTEELLSMGVYLKFVTKPF